MNFNSNRRPSIRLLGFAAILALTGSLALVSSQHATAQVQLAPNKAQPDESKVASKPRLLIETEGFSSEIRAVAFSADGEYVGASTDSDVRIWHIPTGKIYHTIRGFSTSASGVVTSLAVNPVDGSIAIGLMTTLGGTIRTCKYDSLDDTQAVWGDPKDASGPLTALTSQGFRSARALTFSSDGKYLGFLATFSAPDDTGNQKEVLQYVFLDWQTGEVHHTNTAQDLPDGAAKQDFGAQRYRQAGSFYGSDRYYVMPGLNGIFDVRTMQSVDYNASPDLQWFDRFIERFISNYGSLANFSAVNNGSIVKRKAAVAYSAKLNGRDVYQCDIFSGENSKPVVAYKGLSWSPTAVQMSQDCRICAVGDASGRLYVFSSDTGKTLFKTKSIVKASYSAAIDQASGVLAFGQNPHRGAAWKFNDYADLDRGFDLQNRKLIDRPSGQFPRPKNAIDGASTQRKKGDQGSFVDISVPGQQSYSSYPAKGAFFTSTIARGNRNDQKLSFRGGTGYFIADAVQIGPPKEEGASSIGAGSLVAVADSAKTAAASDITLTDDEKFVVGAWTDGAISIYRKSDFEPRRLGNVPFNAGAPNVEELMKDPKYMAMLQANPQKVMELMQQFQVSEFTDTDAAKNLKIGDQILAVDGQNWMAYTSSFYNREEGNQPGDVVEIAVLRDGKEVSTQITLIDDGTQFGVNYVSPLLTFVTTKSDEWILFTPEGYYDASLGGHDLIGWKVNRGPNDTANFFTARQLRKSLYRPEVIDKIISGIV